MLIKVEQKHIDKGQRCAADSCPIALALSEAFKEPIVVSLLGAWSRRFRPEGRLRTKIPSEVLNKIYDFDNGKGMEPFEFEVNFGND